MALPLVSLVRIHRIAIARRVPARRAGADAPLVSVIIPARNEERNIERCVRSVLATRYPSVEVIVVDDHSTDGTGDLVRAIARDERGFESIGAPELPTGWFGKQWACATGVNAARGELLLFTDADTRHWPDLLSRAVNALRARDVGLLSLAGDQEMHSFWERLIQPQMFALLSIRYGGTEHVSNARRAVDVIANGQFILVRRDAYDAVGGHAAVRDRVAEDMSLAQKLLSLRPSRVAPARRATFLHAHVRVASRADCRMAKNIYAGGRHAALGGRLGRALYPAFLLAMPIAVLIPPLALLLSALGVLSSAWLVWSAIVISVTLVFWAAIYRFMGESVLYAVCYPLGVALLLYIAIGSVRRGRRVEWKERTYVSS